MEKKNKSKKKEKGCGSERKYESGCRNERESADVRRHPAWTEVENAARDGERECVWVGVCVCRCIFVCQTGRTLRLLLLSAKRQGSKALSISFNWNQTTCQSCGQHTSTTHKTRCSTKGQTAISLVFPETETHTKRKRYTHYSKNRARHTHTHRALIY